MIASLTGTITSKSPTETVINVNGIGYVLSIPLSTFGKLGEVNSSVTLFTHLHVREDALQLFGFATEEERTLFRLLISVSGIGPKIAQGILSGVPSSELRTTIASGNSQALTAIPGVGKKTAERLVLELRDKMNNLPSGSSSSSHSRTGDVRSETLAALLSLGYNRAAAESSIRKALSADAHAEDSLEHLIKASLKFLS